MHDGKSEIRALGYAPDGVVLAIGRGDGTVGLWDTTQNRLQRVIEAHQGVVTSVAFSPDDYFATGSVDRTVKLWRRFSLTQPSN